MEREVTTPVSLTLANGQLNPEAVGWCRRPLVQTEGLQRGWGRNKRWEYWAITGPTYVVAMTISDIDYAGVHSLFALDRRTGQLWVTDAIAPLAKGASLPATLGAGGASAVVKGLDLAIDEVAGGTRLRAKSAEVEFDLIAHRPEGHECLGVVVPWSKRRFQYTVKDLARPATGEVRIAGQTHEVGGSWATMDHGRGRWPYAITWNWGAGTGTIDGRVVGIQVGGKWTDGTGSTENSVVVDGHLHKIHHELTWEYDVRNWLAPWRVRGPEVDLVFTPEHLREANTNLALVSSATHQCFGVWTGTALGVRVDGAYGWAEDVRQRW